MIQSEQAAPRKPRLIERLLYGQGIDRDAKSRARIGVIILGFACVYAVIAGRMVYLGAAADGQQVRRASGDIVATARPDILDRNGEVLATDVRMPSLFGEPRRIIDVDEAVELLTATMPDMNAGELRERLSSRKGFVWLRREITKAQREQIHRLGIPGIGFRSENKRVYPNGASVSHLIGHVNIDNQGIAGIEKWLDRNGLADLHSLGFANDRLQKPVELALDLRVQHAMRAELLAARAKFKAKAAAGLVTDVNTGEIVAMVSVPDYDPNDPREALDKDRINRLTTGVFEMGSTFKALTVAMALDSGKYTLGSALDARQPLRYGRFTINDFHAQRRVLSLPEVFTYSSNIGTARMALGLGVEHHKQFLKKLGQLDRLRTEIPESAEPLVPRRWGELNTVTIAFGHGLSVAPLQAVMGINALMNGGKLIPPTFLKRSEEEAAKLARQVVKPETSLRMRYLMRLNAEKGSASRAEVKGFYVGGKTGTSEKVINGRYSKSKLLTSFTAVLPADQPKYLVLIMLDEPQPLAETKGYATSGWNAAPTAGKVIARIAPLLGIEPRFDLPPADQLILGVTASARATKTGAR
ncbi:peptidoglycan D,D-transpeptidase FtsI family protein [Pseudorhodoplanes sp.]|uniref:peptidoglycan D,D-transpeptidase FtsI family protein n=1 Tax=Pseudorhodoplanes sp. TaxID=1934341 RepID=UPI00391D64D3